MNTFFTYIQRINSLLLFAGLVVLTLLVLWVVGSSVERGDLDVVTIAKAPGTGEALSFRLDEIEGIRGTDIQMQKLTASEKKLGLAYSNYENDTRNILFLSGDEKTARWLFPSQDNVIHTAAQLRAPAKVTSESGKGGAALALYFVYSDRDTSGDGEITEGDRSKLGLSKANGASFTNVLSGIDHLYSVSLVGNRSISVLYRIGKRLRHARYSVATFGREFDREIAAIPGAEYGVPQ